MSPKSEKEEEEKIKENYYTSIKLKLIKKEIYVKFLVSESY